MDDNPYSSPESDLVSESISGGDDGGVSPSTLELLRRTKTWVRVVGVVLWIGIGFMALAGVGMLMAGLVGGMALGEEGANEFGPLGDGIAMLGVTAGYLVAAALYVVPTIKLWSYGSRIQDLLESHSVQDLEAALDAQRSVWTFVGIAFLAMIGMYVLFFIAAIAVAGFGMWDAVP